MGLEMLRGVETSSESIRQARFWDTTGRNHRTGGVGCAQNGVGASHAASAAFGLRPTTGDLRSDKMRGRETGAQREGEANGCGVGRPAHNEARRPVRV